MKSKLSNIPEELKALTQWVVYRKKQTAEGLKKFMFSPITNDFAKSNMPETWSSFEIAVGYMQALCYDGIAFVLDKGITFIDLDHVVDKETGEITSKAAKEILDLLPDTFTEFSTSGTGIHILCYGNLPENGRCRSKSCPELEMYDNRRFVCFTGKTMDNKNQLGYCNTAVQEINKRYLGERPSNVNNVCKDSISPDDDRLIDKILSSKQADKFSYLYSGNTDSYGSHSQADSALVWLLAFWTRDRMQIDRIFRSSGLFREKWDRSLYNTTYGEDMIDSALSHVKSHRSLEAY